MKHNTASIRRKEIPKMELNCKRLLKEKRNMKSGNKNVIKVTTQKH